MRRIAAAMASLALILGGCSFDPKYVRTDPPVPPSWPTGDAYLIRSEKTLPSIDWRQIFVDPKLQQVIEQALANNRDLAIAAANVASYRALYRVQRAALFPTITGNLSATFSHGGTSALTSGTGTGTGTGTGDGSGSGDGSDTGGSTATSVTTSGASQYYSANIGVSAYEIDLFGRVRSLTRSQLADYFATEAAARSTRLTLVADVANAYLTYASDRSLRAIAEQTVKSAQSSVQLTNARLQGGVAPRTDLAQAQTVLATAQGDMANYTTAMAQDVNQLRLLVGAEVDPSLLPQSIESVDGLLAELPAGLDSTVLLRRPDVVQAEFTLRGANARIGAARAAFFPTISLSALVGFAASSVSKLFTGGAFNWSVAPSASTPIFDAGANKGNLDYARAQRDYYLATYQKTIQTAFQEVADALARRGTIGRQIAAQQDLVRAAQDTYVLTDAAYRGGVQSFLNSLDAQRTFYAAQQNLVSTRLVRAQNLVTLYQVIGGDQSIAGDPAAGPKLASPDPARG